MANIIGSLFYNFGANTKALDSAMARIESEEAKLSDIRVKNADKLQDLNDELANKRYQYAQIDEQLTIAKSKRDTKAVEKYRAELRKLDAQLEKLDNDRLKFAERSKRDEERMSKAIEKQRAEYSKLGAVLGKLRGIAVGLGGVIGGALSVNKFNEIIDKIDALAKRGRDIGLTASQLQELDHQSKLAGISSERLDVSIRAFNRNISLSAMNTGEARKAIAEMGISLTDANGRTKTQNELLRESALWFARNTENAKSAGIASRLFGENGAEMLRVFEQGEDVINKIFDANKIDGVASSAEAYKDALENLGNFVETKLMVSFGKLADIMLTAFGDTNYFETIQKRGFEVVEGLSAKSKNELAKIGAEIMKLEEEFKGMREYSVDILSGVSTRNLDYDKTKKKLEELKQKRRELVEESAKEILRTKENNARLEETKALQERLKKQAEQRAMEEERMVDALFEEEKVLDKIRAKELADAKAKASKVKSQLEAKQNEIAQKNNAREEFELQTKIEILKQQGRTKEAEALEFARKRNELMDKYGYSIEQATKAQKTLDALQKGQSVEYSEEAKKKAQKILARGKGGSVGDKTLAEAQAIVDGKALEGGFSTSMFKQFERKPAGVDVRNLHVDAKASKDKLDKEAEKNAKESVETLKNLEMQMQTLNKLVEELKSSVQMISTQNEHILQ